MVGPYVGCKRLRITMREYFDRVLQDPMMLIVVVVPGLLLVRYYGPESAGSNLLSGLVVHGLLAAIILRKDLLNLYGMVLRKRTA